MHKTTMKYYIQDLQNFEEMFPYCTGELSWWTSNCIDIVWTIITRCQRIEKSLTLIFFSTHVHPSQMIASDWTMDLYTIKTFATSTNIVICQTNNYSWTQRELMFTFLRLPCSFLRHYSRGIIQENIKDCRLLIRIIINDWMEPNIPSLKGVCERNTENSPSKKSVKIEYRDI